MKTYKFPGLNATVCDKKIADPLNVKIAEALDLVGCRNYDELLSNDPETMARVAKYHCSLATDKLKLEQILDVVLEGGSEGIDFQQPINMRTVNDAIRDFFIEPARVWTPRENESQDGGQTART